MPPLVQQYIGCIVGQALGDALGFVVEGYPQDVCLDYVMHLRRGEAGQRGRDLFPFGQYTDDTQLARELLHSYVICQRFDPQDFACRLASMFEFDRIVGRGRTTEQAARRLLAGTPWQESGIPAPAAGNGSAMRAAPIGLMWYDEPRELIRASHDQGRVTHQDLRCSAGAVAVAGAVALVLRDDKLDIPAFCKTLAGWSATLDSGLAEGILRLPGWIALPPERAVEEISRQGLEPGYQDFWQGISPFVTGSVLWALYAFLRTPENYWETICTAIQPGGDVDTTAAMAGAISGARLGVEALPRSLACRVNDRRAWDFDSLKALARQAFALKHP